MKTKKPTPFKYKGNPLKDSRSPFRQSWEKEMDVFRGLPTAPIDTGDWTFSQAGSAQAKNQQFTDFYRDISNPYANISTENLAGELRVNTQAAEFAKQQSMQSQANTMQALQGAAGGSGVASLAQAMSGAQSQQAQQAAASIGQQESANQALRIQGAQDVQRRRELRASGQGQMEMARAGGATAAQMAAAQSGMQQAQIDAQTAIANMQGRSTQQMAQNQAMYTAAADARNLQYQKSQGILSLMAGKTQADRENELAERSWWDSLF